MECSLGGWVLIFAFGSFMSFQLLGLTPAEMARVKAEGGTPGCARGDSLKFWEAKLSSEGKDSNELTIDMSKSGIRAPPKIVVKFEKDGIVFPDGTKWTKTANFAGGRGS